MQRLYSSILTGFHLGGGGKDKQTKRDHDIYKVWKWKNFFTSSLQIVLVVDKARTNYA